MKLNTTRQISFTSMYSTRIDSEDKLELFSAEAEAKKINELKSSIVNNKIKALPPDKELSLFKFPDNQYVYINLSKNNEIKILNSRIKNQLIIETSNMPENTLNTFKKLIEYLTNMAKRC